MNHGATLQGMHELKQMDKFSYGLSVWVRRFVYPLSIGENGWEWLFWENGRRFRMLFVPYFVTEMNL